MTIIRNNTIIIRNDNEGFEPPYKAKPQEIDLEAYFLSSAILRLGDKFRPETPGNWFPRDFGSAFGYPFLSTNYKNLSINTGSLKYEIPTDPKTLELEGNNLVDETGKNVGSFVRKSAVVTTVEIDNLGSDIPTSVSRSFSVTQEEGASYSQKTGWKIGVKAEASIGIPVVKDVFDPKISGGGNFEYSSETTETTSTKTSRTENITQSFTAGANENVRYIVIQESGNMIFQLEPVKISGTLNLNYDEGYIEIPSFGAWNEVAKNIDVAAKRYATDTGVFRYYEEKTSKEKVSDSPNPAQLAFTVDRHTRLNETLASWKPSPFSILGVEGVAFPGVLGLPVIGSAQSMSYYDNPILRVRAANSALTVDQDTKGLFRTIGGRSRLVAENWKGLVSYDGINQGEVNGDVAYFDPSVRVDYSAFTNIKIKRIVLNSGIETENILSIDNQFQAQVLSEITTSELEASGTVVNMTGLEGGNDDDTLQGNEHDNYLSGGQGSDSLFGGAGDDMLEGGKGNDTLDGGEGNDLLFGRAGDDLIFSLEGNNNLFGGEGNDLVFGGRNNDFISGGDGDDTLDGGNGNDVIETGTGDNVAFGGTGDDVITGGIGNNTLMGGGGNDYIEAEGGNNRVDGGVGDNRIFLSSGNDTVVAWDGDNLVNAGKGNDYIIVGIGENYIYGGEGDDTIALFEPSENLSYIEAGTGDDLIRVSSLSGDKDFVNLVMDAIETALLDIFEAYPRYSVYTNTKPFLENVVLNDQEFASLRNDSRYLNLIADSNFGIELDQFYSYGIKHYLTYMIHQYSMKGSNSESTMVEPLTIEAFISGGEGFDTLEIDMGKPVSLNLGEMGFLIENIEQLNLIDADLTIDSTALFFTELERITGDDQSKVTLLGAQWEMSPEIVTLDGKDFSSYNHTSNGQSVLIEQNLSVEIGNNAPSLSDGVIALFLNGSLFEEYSFEDFFVDLDGDSLQTVRIENLSTNTGITLLNNGEIVTVGQEFSMDDLDNFTVEIAPNYIGEFTFQWRASDGVSFSEIATATITSTKVEGYDMMYRFRSDTGYYLYVNETEKNILLEGEWNFTEEGSAFIVGTTPEDDLLPIYRFRNQEIEGGYLYVGEEEKELISANYPNFVEEGLAFYVPSAGSGFADSIYRFQNSAGGYIFVGEGERENILSTGNSSFVEEGIGFEALM